MLKCKLCGIDEMNNKIVLKEKKFYSRINLWFQFYDFLKKD